MADVSVKSKRTIVQWPSSFRAKIDDENYKNTKKSLEMSIIKAKLALAMEDAGMRRKQLEASIKLARNLLDELEREYNHK